MLNVKGLLTLLLVFLCAFTAFADGPGLRDISGSWQGDKSLGTVYVNEDGTGEVTFSHNSEVTMAVTVSINNGMVVIEQNEPNRVEFYNGVLHNNVASALVDKARPMKWVFTLSGNGQILSGKKYTTSVEFDDTDKSNPVYLSHNNDYVRKSRWDRLSGRVAQVQISPEGGSVSSAVQVSLDCSTPGADILYTVDGTSPSASSGTRYTGSINISKTTTVKAVAVKKGWQDSGVVSDSYIFPSKKIVKEDGGDGMTIQTAKRINEDMKKRYYHINDTNYTSMYYKFDVEPYKIYEIRLWDIQDSEEYDLDIGLQKIYGDLEKDSTLPFHTKQKRVYEIVPSKAGTVYLELKNSYYQGHGRFEIRIKETD